MTLFETLQQFKKISPDPAFTEKSKRSILAMTPMDAPVRFSIGRTLAHIFETGIAVGLTVFFVLILTGQFSKLPYVSPAQFSVVNPEALKAEAQAVDIQIQLADVAYTEPTTTTLAATTPAMAGAGGATASGSSSFANAALRTTGGATASSSAMGGASGTGAQGSSTATSTAIVSVDEALKALSK